MFTVPTGYNFHDPVCKGIDFICWPTVGASDVEYYESKGKGIPGLGQSSAGDDAQARLALCPAAERRRESRSRSYFALLPVGKPVSRHGRQPGRQDDLYRHRSRRPCRRSRRRHDPKMENPGAILAFTYAGEGGPGGAPAPTISRRQEYQRGAESGSSRMAFRPTFTAAQAAAERRPTTPTARSAMAAR